MIATYHDICASGMITCYVPLDNLILHIGALIDLVTVESDLGRMGGGAPTETENNLDHFCLQLKPISEIEIERHLSAHGIDGGSFHDRYGAQGVGKSIYIKDPEGL